jgi:hypothetical protein
MISDGFPIEAFGNDGLLKRSENIFEEQFAAISLTRSKGAKPCETYEN